MIKKIILFNLLLAILPCWLYGQQKVPPVQQGGSGQLKISPPPGTGSQASQRSTTLSQGSQNSISIIVDYSGSMKGEPLEAAKNSTLTLIDLIDIWSQLYPAEIGNLQLQYIQFGGANQNNILYKLSPVTDIKALKNLIQNNTTSYSNTDYNSGINLALTELNNLGNVNNKTLFLTDAEDNGSGPSPSVSYDILGDTKFIIYGKGTVDTWLNAVQYSSEMAVANEFEVTTTFVATLFEFVDDISRYLVKRGKQKLDIGDEFKFEKHNPQEAHTIIITRPNPDIAISRVISPTGQELVVQQDYRSYHAGTFLQLVLNASLPKGEYKIQFSGVSRSFDFNYIGFEKNDIYLKMFTTPQLGAGECFVEHSLVNFEFKFWDNTQDVELDYPDFLDFAAYRYKIANSIADTIGTDLNGLRFSISFPTGSAGRYDVMTSWNYNVGKLRNDDPPLQRVGDFCITPDGSLVHVNYDTSLAWEGRDIEFTASLTEPDPQKLRDIKTIYLNTNRGLVELKQVTANTNNYRGKLENVVPAFYQLSIENKDSRYILAIDNTSITQFQGKKRHLVFRIDGIDYSGLRKTLGWWDKIKVAFSDLFGSVVKNRKTFTYQAVNDLTIPYKIPFSAPFDERVKIDITLNKIFPDENANIYLEVSGGDSVFSCQDVKIRSFWGLFRRTQDIKNAVLAKFFRKGSIPIRGRGNVEQILHIVKQEGEMYFEQPLYREPQMRIEGILRVEIAPNNVREIKLESSHVVFEITTDSTNRWLSQASRLGKVLLSLMVLLFLLLLSLLFLLIRRRLRNTKLELWAECKGSNPQDFFDDFPESIQKEIEELHRKNKENTELFPHGSTEAQEIRLKRIFREEIRKDEFDLRVVKKCGKDFLLELQEKLDKPNIGSDWTFYGIDDYESVEITKNQDEPSKHKERIVRTRVNIASNYGQLVKEGDKHYFKNNEVITTYTDGSYDEQPVGLREKIEVKTGTILKIFGPDDKAAFRLVFSIMHDQLTITIKR